MKIGFGLQGALLKKAKELSFDQVWLSVLHSNERAINFYKKRLWADWQSRFSNWKREFRIHRNEQKV